MKKENKIKFEKNAFQLNEKAFTLIELLITIGIIGILSGIVLVSTQGSVEKSKRASAMTTLSSVLPEMVACQDDGGAINAYNTASKICNGTGHTVLWPPVITKTGYTVNAAAATNLQIVNYTFTATKTGQQTITCSYATNDCS
jgi:prepilin-type N-terminal cleavage/methylation domain-containing protein